MCRATVEEATASYAIRAITVIKYSCFLSHKVSLLFTRVYFSY